MLTEEQIEAIAQKLGEFQLTKGFLGYLDPLGFEELAQSIRYVAPLIVRAERDQYAFCELILSEEQIEAIAEELYRKSGEIWEEVSPDRQSKLRERINFIANKAIAIQAEQDRRSFTAVGKYIGVKFTAGTDVVSEVYDKLDEIMTVFREHSQEIAIAQQIKTLINQLEKYNANQESSFICAGAVGKEAGRLVCAREGLSPDTQG